jgi:hypothetical protein
MWTTWPEARAELRTRLSVTPLTLPDEVADRCLIVAAAMIDTYVPVGNRTDPRYAEGVQALAVRVYEERVRGRVGVGPDGEPVEEYTPGPTEGMVRSVWGYIGPLTRIPMA